MSSQIQARELEFDTRGNEKQKYFLTEWFNPNPKIIRVLYGGTKGCAKSTSGCAAIFGNAIVYPKTLYFIARKQLNDMRIGTKHSVEEYFDLIKYPKSKWKYHGTDNFYELGNGSIIYFLAATADPSDPEFSKFGSKQFTQGWIEEAGELTGAAVRNLMATVGRWKNDYYGIPGRTLETFNPSKNYLYGIRKQWEKGTLPDDTLYIRAFLKDNKMLPASYFERLERVLSDNEKQRLLYDNWDYDDDPKVLCDSDAIQDLFTNDFIEEFALRRQGFSVENRLSSDLAMQGRDKFIAAPAKYFHKTSIDEDLKSFDDGYLLVNFTIGIDKEKSSGKSIETDLKNKMMEYHISHSRTIADSDGMGQYLESYLEGIKQFHGNANPNPEAPRSESERELHAKITKEFANLKSRCAWRLREYVNRRRMRIICSPEQRERIVRELGVMKAVSLSTDEQKKQLIPKDKSRSGNNQETMKGLLGHSPDYLDVLIMLMYFEFIDNNHNLWDLV